MESEAMGFNFILWGNMVRRQLPEDMRAFVDSVDPASWYPTEKLIALLSHLRDTQGAVRLDACGRAIYYTLKEDLEKMGVHTPEQALLSIVHAYEENVRGSDAGEWRLLENEPNRVVLEDRTCFAPTMVNVGVAIGAAKAFGGQDVQAKVQTRHEGEQMIHVIEVSWTD